MVWASDENSGNSEERMLLRAKRKVDNAKAGDWKTLADCANDLIKKGISSEDELEWINRSIALNENIYNISLLGDYFILKREYKRAIENYLKAIQLARIENNTEAIPTLQWKVLITLGTQNYYKSLKDSGK
jgi:hypothetical protein